MFCINSNVTLLANVTFISNGHSAAFCLLTYERSPDSRSVSAFNQLTSTTVMLLRLSADHIFTAETDVESAFNRDISKVKKPNGADCPFAENVLQNTLTLGMMLCVLNCNILFYRQVMTNKFETYGFSSIFILCIHFLKNDCA